MKEHKRKLVLIIGIVFIVGLVSYVLLRINKMAISKIEMDKANINLFVGEVEKIGISINPENSKGELIWESSDEGIAIVDDNGVITAISEGMSLITVKTKDNKVSDSCVVNVYKSDLEQIMFRESYVEIRIGENKTLDVSANPPEVKEMLSFISSDETIVKVDEKGKIIGIRNGKVTISIKVRENIVARCEVKVVIPVETLEMENEAVNIALGESEELKFVITPLMAANQEVIWKSSNENVATVENGKVITKEVGETIITASIDGKEAGCRVSVIIPVREIKLNKTTINMNVGQSETLKAVISPMDATNNVITWTSSNEKIVKVDANGKVIGIGAGEVTITASAGGKEATCNIISTYTPITNNGKYSANYNLISLYDSETFKYRILQKGDGYYSLVWVMDAHKQWNSAFPKLGYRYVQSEVLRSEVNKYKYQNKGMIATNGGPFWDNWGDTPCTPFIINKGKIIRDIQNTTYKTVDATIGMTKEGILKVYGFSKESYQKNQMVKQEILNDGVVNSFSNFGAILSSGKPAPKDKLTCNNYCFNKTVLCQVDNNNFVIFSGGKSLNYNGVAKILRDSFNCSSAYAFDGGSSSGLFYKTNSSKIQMINNGRDVPDMMYFVEQ